MNFEFLMRETYKQALKSPDPSTQNGAIIVDDSGLILSTGCNGFPNGVENKPERLIRPDKYAFIEHAERVAIYECARLGIPTEGKTMICPWFSCADCARAISCAGIKLVIGHSARINHHLDRWKESIERGNTILDEHGTLRQYIDFHLDFPIMVDSELWQI